MPHWSRRFQDLAQDLADFAAQAADQLIARVVSETFDAIRAAGERDYLTAEDIEDIYRLIARVMAEHRWRAPAPAQIVETCQRLDIPVVL
jgi:hypothetical protein